MLAYADTHDGPEAGTRLFAPPQLIAPGVVDEQVLLPSFRYHPAPEELPEHLLRLPWPDAEPDEDFPPGVVGVLARDLGGKVPGRLVSSAKSWLCHPSVDRTAPVLPWGGAEGVAKISPLHASASYLRYLRDAWNHAHPDEPLEQQDVVLTLPASFDEAARALTVEAAELAGLKDVHLLEEPQAACYDWLARHHTTLEEALAETRLLLVCDVGGGTTDLTLIQVEQRDDGPRLTRIGVGDHLMLGGDNMDLALAHAAEARLAGSRKLATGELAQLLQQARGAKEALLGGDAPAEVKLTLLGGGSKLVGGARSTALARAEAETLVLDGFFPRAAPDQRPSRRQSAIIEFGLPYVADPAVTRHVAAFLAQHAAVAREALGDAAPAADALPVADTILLNGGVFHSEALARRLLETLGDWRGAPLRQLLNDDPDLAVARGAVAYGLARRGKGLRIGGGSARSYFLMLGSEDNQGVCLLPRGTEEDTEVRLREREFLLRLGQPVRFHLASTTADRRFQPGEVVGVNREDFTELPPIAAVLEQSGGGREVPVQLSTRLTEVGTLDMACVARDTDQRWQLAFQLRGNDAGTVVTEGKPHPRFDEAASLIQGYYGGKSQKVDPRGIKTLRTDLEKLLGKRDTWETPLLRELFAVLLEGAKRRRRSADHERLWCNLSGFCLRPGFGYPLDDWRVEQLWKLYPQGIQHSPEAQVWAEWWTLWRRVAGGLEADAQEAILDDIGPYLLPPEQQAKLKGPRKQGHDDMVRLVGSLERLPAARKTEVGEWLLARLDHKNESNQTWWAVGRLGARVPFHGSAHNVVRRDTAARWLAAALARDWKQIPPAAFAATLLARMSGDRERDLEPALREQVLARLREIRASESWIAMVSEVGELSEADERQFYGDSLPPGLKLLD